MALAGIRVLELEGIGPGPLSSCILADFGADVVTISRVVKGSVASRNDPVSRGKRSIALDLKSPEGVATLKALAAKADVFIEPFRPGVTEKMGIGPDILCRGNPRLIYGRMTGFGQGGNKFEKMAGHDANYLALSGVLDMFRRGDERPMPPANFAGDYAGGGMLLAMGILLAVIERSKSGKGQVVDAAMVDGAAYIALPLFKWMSSGGPVPVCPDGHINPKESILHQGSHFCDSYLCKEHPAKQGTKQYMSVQAIEPEFYKVLLECLGLSDVEGLPAQYDREAWPWMKVRFAQIFLTKTRDEWAEIFYGTDACCVPILNATEAGRFPHNVARGTFAPTCGSPGVVEPAPAPKLSRTPGFAPRPHPTPGGDTRQVLKEFGFSDSEVHVLFEKRAVAETLFTKSKL